MRKLLLIPAILLAVASPLVPSALAADVAVFTHSSPGNWQEVTVAAQGKAWAVQNQSGSTLRVKLAATCSGAASTTEGELIYPNAWSFRPIVVTAPDKLCASHGQLFVREAL